MRRFPSWLGAVGLALPLVAAGCVVPVNFDPTGNEVALKGSWKLQMGDMGTPEDPTAANCSALGVVNVQLVFYAEFDSQSYRSDVFKFPCEQGSFDSTSTGFGDADGNVLAHGTYRTQWMGLDDQGNQVGKSAQAILDVTFDSMDTVPAIGGSDVIVVPTMSP